MARKALVVKCDKGQQELAKSLAKNKKPTYPTKVYNRCKLCGRNKGYMRKFQMCRICFRENASEGFIMGVKKSSW